MTAVETRAPEQVKKFPLTTLTAMVVGSMVILFDPIFQGLAIALMAGEIASLALSRITVPVLYFMVAKHLHKGEPQPVVAENLQRRAA